MQVGALVHQGFLVRVDVETHAFQGQVASDSVRKREWEGRGADGRSEGPRKDVDDGRVSGFRSIWFDKVGCHQVLARLRHYREILVLVERIQAGTQHFLLQSDRVLLVSPCWRFQFPVIVAFLVDPELLAELVNDGMVQDALLSFFLLTCSTQLALQHWFLELVLRETFIEGSL